MNNLVEFLKLNENVFSIGNVAEETIEEYEKKLELRFAEDYREYIKEFGIASVFSHELTGICESKRLNVADVTLKEKEQINVPDDFYVVEDTGIDGIVIWQNPAGEIFATQPGFEMAKINDSILDYLTKK